MGKHSLIPVKRKAKNLKIAGLECVGDFFYDEIIDHRMSPPIIIRRESWLEFNVSEKTTEDLFYQSLTTNEKIEVSEKGKAYEGYMSQWKISLKGNQSGRIEMIDKWYE